jgi:hypothetical protein
VVIEQSGGERIEPAGKGRDRLAQIWAAFKKRHPMYRERVACRDAVMKEMSGCIVSGAPVPTTEAKRKIGGNDPCPLWLGK